MKDYGKQLTGDTIKATWINSANTPSALICSVFNGAEVLVDSGAMVDSGDTFHYYFNHTIPDTPGNYVVQMLGTIGGKPYKRRMKYRAILDEVD